MRDTGILSKGTLKKILPDWGGVQVRCQGFRVYPYGDDDWLGIDHDRGLRKRIPMTELRTFAESLQGIDPVRVLLNMLSMRSYVGNVEIGERAAGFEMKSNREGFLYSDAVNELKDFVRFAVDWSTIYRSYYLHTRKKADSETARERLEAVTGEKIEKGKEVESAVDYIRKEVEHISTFLPEQEKVSLKKSVHDAVKLILSHSRASQEELSHLRLIASTSTLLLIFSHEVKDLLGELETSKNTMHNLEAKLPDSERFKLKKLGETFDGLKIRLQELLEMTSLVGIDSRKEKPKQLALHERVVRAVDIFSLIINKYEIEVDYDQVPHNIVFKAILEAELYAILLNVLSNSIKSVIAAGGPRKIRITAGRSEGKTVIKFSDTGIGLEPARYDEVFIPFISDPGGRLYTRLNDMLNPEDKYIVGTGSGLGLSIVREIVRARNGRVFFKEPEGEWKTQLEMILP